MECLGARGSLVARLRDDKVPGSSAHRAAWRDRGGAAVGSVVLFGGWPGIGSRSRCHRKSDLPVLDMQSKPPHTFHRVTPWRVRQRREPHSQSTSARAAGCSCSRGIGPGVVLLSAAGLHDRVMFSMVAGELPSSSSQKISIVNELLYVFENKGRLSEMRWAARFCGDLRSWSARGTGGRWTKRLIGAGLSRLRS